MKLLWLLTGLGLMLQGCTSYGYRPGYGYGYDPGYGYGYRPWYSGWRYPVYRHPPPAYHPPPPVLPRVYQERRWGPKPFPPHWNRRPWPGGQGTGFVAGREGHGAGSGGQDPHRMATGRRRGDGAGVVGGTPGGRGSGRRSGYAALSIGATGSDRRRGHDSGFSGGTGPRGRRR